MNGRERMEELENNTSVTYRNVKKDNYLVIQINLYNKRIRENHRTKTRKEVCDLRNNK